MDWLTFIATIAGHVAWPIATLCIVWIFRKPILLLLQHITKLKWKELEVSFEAQVAEAKSEAAEVLPPAKPQIALPAPVQALLAASPQMAIVQAWTEVEDAARVAVAKHDPMQPVQPYVSAQKIRRALEDANVLTPSELGLFQELRALRNQAAHTPDFVITEEAARDYVQLAARLVERLRSS
ncbi:MAG: hypothetical protein ACJ796_08870 [Gemmatimonadaceae bacterium]